MRLICPNCEAQYEVADNAIPAGGRDVQCSNCGNTWYQMPIGADGAAPAARSIPPTGSKAETAAVKSAKATGTVDKAEPAVADNAAPAEKPKAGRKAKAESGASASTEPEVAPDSPIPESATPDPQLPPRKVDNSVLEVLREEAEREAAKRKAEAEAAAAALAAEKAKAEAAAAATLAAATAAAVAATAKAAQEQQDSSDEGAAATPTSSAVAKLQAAIATKPAGTTEKTRNEARETAADEAIAAAVAATLQDDPAAASRQSKGRELLPDIEEIKSSLRSTNDNPEAEEDQQAHEERVAAGRQGFRRGFMTMLLLGILLTTAYVSAPRIVALIPASKAVMTSYVANVDSARLWLDGMLRQATSSIEGEQTTAGN